MKHQAKYNVKLLKTERNKHNTRVIMNNNKNGTRSQLGDNQRMHGNGVRRYGDTNGNDTEVGI